MNRDQEALPRLLTLGVFQRYLSCNNRVRSPLAPLKKGGTVKFLKIPLFKGDLGGSKLRTVVIKSQFTDKKLHEQKTHKKAQSQQPRNE